MTTQCPTLTTESGAPVADNKNSQTAGPADATYGSRVEEALAAARI